MVGNEKNMRMILFKKVAIVLPMVFLLGFLACSDEGGPAHHDNHDHDTERFRLTAWQDEYEIFSTFHLHDHPQRIEGEIVLSYSEQPLGDADGQLHFEKDGQKLQSIPLEMVRPGVYPFEYEWDDKEGVELVLELQHRDTLKEIKLGDIHPSQGSVPDEPLQEITVLDKDQQWQLGVETASVGHREIPNIVQGFGSIHADPRYRQEMTSPVDGIVRSGDGARLPISGEQLEGEQPVMLIAPSLSAENSWTALRQAYLQAKEAYERGKRLLEEQAISRREFEIREREFITRRAGYREYIRPNGNTIVEDHDELLSLKTTEAGMVDEVYVTTGALVQRGDPLITFFDPDHLWAELYGYSDELAMLDQLDGVEIRAQDGKWHYFGDDRFTLISRSDRTDATGIRDRLTLSVDNGDRLLRKGQPVQVRLISNGAEAHPVVPESAIFDEHSHKVVFVQHSGDQFERRVVNTGARSDGWVAVTRGVDAGERVVTKGVYTLFLASSNIQMEHGHSH